MAENYLPESVHEEFAQRIMTEWERLRDEDKRQNERIELLEKQQDNLTQLTISVKELTLEVKNMVGEIASHNTRISTLENRDGDKWRKLISGVITAVVGALVGFALARIGIIS